jgi:hypothetical protein
MPPVKKWIEGAKRMLLRKRGTQKDERSIAELKPGTMITPPADELREMIARRAFALYEERGAVCGDELTDWVRAEQEVSAELGMRHSGTDNAEAPVLVSPINGQSSGRRITTPRNARVSLPIKRNRKTKSIQA